MKTKKETKTNTSRIIFFTIALTYNLILGFYLRDFLVFSPILQVFYLLSILPCLFLIVEIKTKAMRSVVYILIMLIACMNITYAIYCRRVGYTLITIAFIGQLVCAFFAFKPSDKQKVFYNMPLVTISYAGLIVMLIAGTACMAIPNLPNWVGIIVCLLVLAITAIAVLSAAFAASVVTEIDQQVKVKTFFVKSLTVDSEHLMNTAKTAELKALAKKVYEAVRYSDPMSNAVLVEVEEKIQNGFSDFENAVNGEDYELASSTADELLSLIDIRNKKCKLLK